MRGDNGQAFTEFERKLVAECGLDCHRKCLEMIFGILGGMRMTIPDLDELYRRERNRRIRNEFHGNNYEELAIKYRLQIRQVRNIVGRG